MAMLNFSLLLIVALPLAICAQVEHLVIGEGGVGWPLSPDDHVRVAYLHAVRGEYQQAADQLRIVIDEKMPQRLPTSYGGSGDARKRPNGAYAQSRKEAWRSARG